MSVPAADVDSISAPSVSGSLMIRAPTQRITRFTVMAMLQAARARRLGLPERSALSWGLNRAIFYAAAKKGFRGVAGPPRAGEPSPRIEEKSSYVLGDELAYRDPESSDLLFTIGGETQTEEAFRKQVAVRFGGERDFRRAWNEALALVGGFDDGVLMSGHRFYSAVYKPRRDELVEKWTDEFGAPSAST